MKRKLKHKEDKIMERMLIKHLSGSKANQVEEFALKYHNELIFGRDANSTVKYDPDRDDTVSRQYAKVTRDPNDADGFLVADMNSRSKQQQAREQNEQQMKTQLASRQQEAAQAGGIGKINRRR
ncbi:MAG: hypothetical protein ACR2L1_06355 [Pyrinomonadaceae bacterium]